MANKRPARHDPAESDSNGDDPVIGDINKISTPILASDTAVAVYQILRDRAARGGFITYVDDPDTIAQRGILQICDAKNDTTPLLCEIREAIAHDARPEMITNEVKLLIEELARRIIKQCKDAERHRLRWPHIPETAEEVVTWTRKRTPYNEHVGDHADAIPAPEMPEDSPLVTALRDILKGLPDVQRAVIQLAYWENHSAKEIGDKTGLTPRTVTRIRKQAEATLAARLRE